MKEEDDNMDFLVGFRKNTGHLTKTKADFKSFIEAPITTLAKVTDNLLSNPINFIMGELKAIDYENIQNIVAARVQFLLNRLDKKSLIEYRNFINDKYSNDYFKLLFKEIEENYKTLLEKSNEYKLINKNLSKELINDKKVIDKSHNDLNHYLARIDSLKATFDELVPENIMGDETLDVNELESVYFEFPVMVEVDEKFLMSFVKDVRRVQSDAVNLIKRVTFKDSTVLFWFESNTQAETFYSAKTFIEASYEKYLRRVQRNNVKLDYGISYGKYKKEEHD